MPGTEKKCRKNWDDPRTLPNAVLNGEAEYIRDRREAAGLDATPPKEAPENLVGICLSGGGIRSATFSLGVLRGLAGAKLLRLADYLCTVSGGGYIGSCLSSLMTVRPPKGEGPKIRDRDEWKRSSVDNAGSGSGDATGPSGPKLGAMRFDMDEEMPLLDYHQMHHLRKHGNYLILRHGFLRREVLRTVGAVVGGVFCMLAFFGVLMIALSAAFICYSSALTQGDFWADARRAENHPSPLKLSVDGKAVLGQISFKASASAREGDEPTGEATTGWPALRDFTTLLWGKPNPAGKPTGAEKADASGRKPLDTNDAGAIVKESSGATKKGGSPVLAWCAAVACGVLLAGILVAISLIWTWRSYAVQKKFDSHKADAATEHTLSRKKNRWGFFIPRQGFSGETREDAGERRKLWVLAILTLFFGGFGAPLAVDYVVTDVGNSAPAGHVLLPLACFLGTLITAIFLYVLLVMLFTCCPWLQRFWNREFRSIYGTVMGLIIYMTLAAAIFGALTPILHWVVRSEDWLWLIAAAVVSLATTRLAAQRAGPVVSPSATMRWLRGFVTPVVLVLSVCAFLLVAFLLCGRLLISSPLEAVRVDDCWSGLWGTLIVGGIFLVAGIVIDFNRISPHYFYRDRLSAAYLQTEAKQNGLLRIERDDYTMKLKDLHGVSNGQEDFKNPAPYQLVICALNLAGSRDLARKDRKSDHFLFSRKFCGSTTTGYVSTKVYQNGRTKLSAAMTISGAALSSGMGFHTGFCQAFAMTIFNIRLGYWWEHPWVWAIKKKEEIHHAPCWEPIKDDTEHRSCRARLARHVARCRGRFVFWPLYLLREMLGQTTARSMLVNLSDGGHTGDNIGVYPLLQRRCRLIIAADGEADPNLTFGSFVSAIRQIYTDENVKVFIDLDRVRPQQTDEKRSSPYVIGKIVYPCAEKATEVVPPSASQPGNDDPSPATPPVVSGKAGQEEEAGNIGWIIYLKSSFHDDREPATVGSYAATNPGFPHQTTVDQFFDDDQFEAYRVLGEYIAETVNDDFSAWCDAEVEKPSKSTRELIRWCRKEYASQDVFEW